MSVLVVTSVGDIVVDLYTDRCPLTCKNFLKLCKIKYYNGCLFHTVQKDFTAQTGDPTGTGTGGDSIYKFLYGEQARFFSDEIHLDLKHSKTGMIGMASAGENLNASQFYFTLRDDLDYLDGKHTVFGEIAEGLETLTRINEAYIDEKHRPYKNIRIKHTYILDDPFEDPPQLAALVPGASPEGKPKDEVADDVRLEDDWVPMDEQLGPGEIEEILQDKKARESAVLLETIGDIPDAEIKPPDNVLFVCKLNPVTEDEDLHTIFSRFGTCVSADIIRDYKTGDSLCYAFIEFETTESCQEAYFKMDNALIDDRRIHVDFSQSVAKLWSQYRRKDNPGAKGRGCFKCGAPDHMAKDCNGGPATVPQSRKYILRDVNTQHGGDDNSRYDMVFDGDTSENPRHEKTHGSPDKADINKLKMHATNQGLKARDPENKVSSDRSRGSDRNRGGREEEHRHEIKDGQYSAVRRDKEGYVNRRKEGKEYDDYGRGGHRKEHASGKDDRDYRKRSSDSASHVEKKKESGDYRKRHEDKDYRKRNADDDHRGDLVDDRDHRKRHADDGRRDGRREDREGKHHGEESDYRKRNADDDHRGDLVDDRDHRKRRADDGRREYRRHSEESEYGQQRDGDKRRYGDSRR